MSQSERERALRALVDEWRDGNIQFDGFRMELQGGKWIALRCADELAAALDTPQEPTPADEPDEQWLERVRKLLPEGSPIPLFYKRDGSINREKTMELPCFAAAPEPTPAAPPTNWSAHIPVTYKELRQTLSDMMNSVDTDKPAGEAGHAVLLMCRRLVDEKLERLAAAPRPALSPDAAASSGDDKGEGR